MNGTVKKRYVSPYVYPGLAKVKTDLTIDEVIKEVCEYFHITHDELAGKGRNKNIVTARAYVIYTCRKFTNYTFEQIGKALNRDHSSIMHLNKKFHDDIGIYPTDKNLYAKFLDRINYTWSAKLFS